MKLDFTETQADAIGILPAGFVAMHPPCTSKQLLCHIFGFRIINIFQTLVSNDWAAIPSTERLLQTPRFTGLLAIDPDRWPGPSASINQ